MKNKVNETLEMDMVTYKKVKGTLDPKTTVKITGDKPNTSTTSLTSVKEDAVEPEAIIEPKDKATIKYLSNVKDSKTGEISKPFTIRDKRYQMVRGIMPDKEIVMAVYCHDDLNEAGENIIHQVDQFEESIVKPFMKENEYNADNYNSDERDFHDKNNLEIQPSPKKEDFDYASSEIEYHDKESFLDYLNLSDLVGYKHFFVNIKTGDVVAKFKSTKDMIKSGIKLGPQEDYMDVKSLKRFRFGDYFKGKDDVSEEAPVDSKDGGTNIPKLQSDVKKLAKMIKDKFSNYLAKLNKPIEQSQFLTAMAAEVGVPLNKLTGIINTYKDIAKDATLDKTNTPALQPEARVITKDELKESLKKKKVIRTIKIKDIKWVTIKK